MRQGNTFFIDDRYPGYGNFKDYRRRLAAEVSAFTRCLRCFLRGPEDNENLRVELKALGFAPDEVTGYMGAANKQCAAHAPPCLKSMARHALTTKHAVVLPRPPQGLRAAEDR